jgi:hypothetical protein
MLSICNIGCINTANFYVTRTLPALFLSAVRQRPVSRASTSVGFISAFVLKGEDANLMRNPSRPELGASWV